VSDLARILAVLGLVAANAFFVVGEYAVVTARRAGLRERASSGRRGARAALRLMDNPVQVISTVQVGITAVGILTGAIGEPLVRDVSARAYRRGWVR
jgi:putative hemolysin